MDVIKTYKYFLDFPLFIFFARQKASSVMWLGSPDLPLSELDDFFYVPSCSVWGGISKTLSGDTINYESKNLYDN